MKPSIRFGMALSASERSSKTISSKLRPVRPGGSQRSPGQGQLRLREFMNRSDLERCQQKLILFQVTSAKPSSTDRKPHNPKFPNSKTQEAITPKIRTVRIPAGISARCPPAKIFSDGL